MLVLNKQKNKYNMMKKTERGSKGEDTKDKFIKDFGVFYTKLFSETANAIDMLADLQKKYPKDFLSIQEIQKNPLVLAELSKKMGPDAQARLINILIQASSFNKRLTNLMESSEKEKRSLAKDLRAFGEKIGM